MRVDVSASGLLYLNSSASIFPACLVSLLEFLERETEMSGCGIKKHVFGFARRRPR